MTVVIMMTIEMCMGGDVWVCIGLTQETELTFYLWQQLAPEVEGKFVVCAADDRSEMILPGLNRFFGNVPSMVVGWNQLVGHAGVGDGHFVCGRYFIIQDLSGGANPTGFHALEFPHACKDMFTFVFFLNGSAQMELLSTW
jgi:hypothetical protein